LPTGDEQIKKIKPPFEEKREEHLFLKKTSERIKTIREGGSWRRKKQKLKPNDESYVMGFLP